ncbi:MAG: biotin/lipoyl-containing protein [Trueperaceae bacterium]|nr:biotin/lipoyl-containing protein [Trueperaceae bacterium]
MAVELKVPEVGESITEVFIGEWLKQEGDTVEKDEPVVEVETDKATLEVPASVAGRISKVLKKEGDTAEVGEVIAHISEEGDAEAAPAEAKQPEPEPEAKQPESGAKQPEPEPEAKAPEPETTSAPETRRGPRRRRP